MTAVCGGGPSSPKSGVDSVIDLSGVAIAAQVAAWGFPELGVPISLIAGGTALATDVYCTNDPVALPTLTVDDFLAIAQPHETLAFFQASTRIRDWFLHHYWFMVCACTTAVAVPSPIVAPPGVGTDTSLPTGTTSTPCWDIESPITINGGTVNVGRGVDTISLLPGATVFTYTQSLGTGSENVTSSAKAIPPGANNLRAAGSIDVRPSPGNAGLTYAINFFDASRTWISQGFGPHWTDTSLIDQSLTIPIPAAAAYWSSYLRSSDGAAHTPTLHVSFFCSGTGPTGLEVPCCPPDPLVQRYLQQILAILNTLLQPHSVTGWRDGQRHAGLAGNGSFLLGDLTAMGLRVEVKTPPAHPNVLPGTPNFYWNMGFITPIALTSPLKGWRLVFLSQSFELPEFTDQIGYTLLDGTVVDMVELLPVLPTSTP